MPTNFGCNVYMSCVLCNRSERGWEWGVVEGGGQVTEFLSLSVELLLRVPTGGRGVVETLALLAGRGRKGLVRHASCRREREGWDAKLGIPQRGKLMWPLKSVLWNGSSG